MKKYAYIFAVTLLGFLTYSCDSSDDSTSTSQEMSDDMDTDSTTDEPDDTTDDTNEPDETTDDPLDAVVFTDVSYGSDAEQVYDLYLPAGRSSDKTKVLVLIHGGSWVGGDKDDMALFVNFAQTSHPNHAIVNLNYVLAALPNTPAFPNQYLDIQAALAQITAQQEDLQILPEFGFIGVSAGAHLGMMYDYVYDTTDQVKFVIDIVGPSDFSDPFFADDPDFELALSFLVDESQFPAGTDLVAANSPASQVTTMSSPTALFYGNMDPIVPLTNGETLEAALTATGITHDFTVYVGGHGDNWSQADQLDLTLQTNGYITTYLPVE